MFNMYEKAYGFPSINDTVVIGKRSVHHRFDGNSVIYDNRTLLNRVHA
jgi:hypothetical protein